MCSMRMMLFNSQHLRVSKFESIQSSKFLCKAQLHISQIICAVMSTCFLFTMKNKHKN